MHLLRKKRKDKPHTNVALLDVIQATWINMLPSVEYRLHRTTRKSQQIKIEKKIDFFL